MRPRVTYRGTYRGTLKGLHEELSTLSNPLGEKELQAEAENSVRANPVIPVIPVKSTQSSQASAKEFVPVPRDDEKSLSDDSDLNCERSGLFGVFRDNQERSSPTCDNTHSFSPQVIIDRLERLVADISHGEFDPDYLKKYAHPQELLDCCEHAIGWVPHDAVRHKDPAGIMAHAMESMRQMYGLDVPKGWVPVMRELRGANGGRLSAN